MIEILISGQRVFKLVAIALVLGACSFNEAISPQPAILVNSLDPQQWDRCISGSVEGVDPRYFYIAIYKGVDDRWFSIRGEESIEISLKDDQTWHCPTHSQDIKSADVVQIFMFPTGFEAPIMTGENVLPLKVHLAAATKMRLDLTQADS